MYSESERHVHMNCLLIMATLETNCLLVYSPFCLFTETPFNNIKQVKASTP